MKTAFQKLYERPPACMAEAPGRVNLIGEHTDYNGGFVLPTLIPQKTIVHLAPRSDSKVQLATMDRDGNLRRFHFLLGEEHAKDGWGDYVQGLTWLYAREGIKIQGFDAMISSHVPMGAGLSSSAALLVAFSRAIRQAFSLDLNDVQIALLCQRVENEFVGARVGIMDQMAISLGDQEHALFLDTRDLSSRLIALPWDRMDLFVINSGVRHRLMEGGGYNSRRSECEEACHLLGVKQLRDVESSDRLSQLPELYQKRARHVVTENQRVLDAVQALQKGDMKELGRLMQASHASMRDDYEVSVQEIDILVEESMREPQVFGARLTGGGFGGSIVGICEPGQARAVAQRIVERASRRFDETPSILVPE
ncbi:galactokinase [Oligoflexus tunisiensis]|uniref:galactokinase n=1 Tax=Oligoflexus tunisiensis TaxID=708132 RepID=UPI000AAC759A|nr:galactokinase [Oligoflexus tunisiensis]